MGGEVQCFFKSSSKIDFTLYSLGYKITPKTGRFVLQISRELGTAKTANGRNILINPFGLT